MMRRLLYLASGWMLLAMVCTPIVSAEMITMNGKIMGAQCALAGGICAKSMTDPRDSMEREFVFVAANGKSYFMSNVGRIPKVRLINMPVTVTGRFGDESIFVESIDAEMKDLYPSGRDWQGATVCCWSWSERIRDISFPR